MESKIQSQVIKYLKSVGAYVVKIVLANKTGIPDVVFCLNGQFVAFEIKTPTGALKPLQEFNLNEIKKAGGKAFCVRSLEQAKEIIETL